MTKEDSTGSEYRAAFEAFLGPKPHDPSWIFTSEIIKNPVSELDLYEAFMPDAIPPLSVYDSDPEIPWRQKKPERIPAPHTIWHTVGVTCLAVVAEKRRFTSTNPGIIIESTLPDDIALADVKHNLFPANLLAKDAKPEDIAHFVTRRAITTIEDLIQTYDESSLSSPLLNHILRKIARSALSEHELYEEVAHLFAVSLEDIDLDTSFSSENAIVSLLDWPTQTEEVVLITNEELAHKPFLLNFQSKSVRFGDAATSFGNSEKLWQGLAAIAQAPDTLLSEETLRDFLREQAQGKKPESLPRFLYRLNKRLSLFTGQQVEIIDRFIFSEAEGRNIHYFTFVRPIEVIPEDTTFQDALLEAGSPTEAFKKLIEADEERRREFAEEAFGHAQTILEILSRE